VVQLPGNPKDTIFSSDELSFSTWRATIFPKRQSREGNVSSRKLQEVVCTPDLSGDKLQNGQQSQPGSNPLRTQGDFRVPATLTAVAGTSKKKVNMSGQTVNRLTNDNMTIS
jgi:hypothetical protein